jgi:hypothetical protein
MTLTESLLENGNSDDRPEIYKYLSGDFQQAKLLSKKPRNIQEGVCMAACANWIETHKNYRSCFGKKKPTDVRLDVLKKKHNIDAICQLQIKYEDALSKNSDSITKGNYQSILDEFLSRYDLSLEKANFTQRIAKYPGKISKHGFSESSISQSADLFAVEFEDFANFVNVNHRYHIINFNGSNPHTICCYMSSGKIFGYGKHLYVFEPNRGEFKVPASDIPKFFALLVFTHISLNAFNSEMVAYRIK